MIVLAQEGWKEGTEYIKDVTDQAGRIICPNCNVATLKGIEAIFRLILNIVIRLGGVVVFIFLIIGGFKYLTAGGDPKKAESAKNTITYAILGLALLILAWFVLQFIKVFTGIDVTIFKMPSP